MLDRFLSIDCCGEESPLRTRHAAGLIARVNLDEASAMAMIHRSGCGGLLAAAISAWRVTAARLFSFIIGDAESPASRMMVNGAARRRELKPSRFFPGFLVASMFISRNGLVTFWIG